VSQLEHLPNHWENSDPQLLQIKIVFGFAMGNIKKH
jgi:hypothetical protein